MQMRWLIDKDDVHQKWMAKKLAKSRPGEIIECSKDELEAMKKIIPLGDWRSDDIADLEERISRLEELNGI